MEYEDLYDESIEETTEPTLPERKQSPYRKKQLDYKHQVRLLSSGNRGYRRALKLLPQLERRSYRRALDAATNAARRDEDAELTSADKLKTLRRSMFSRLVTRKALPLREALQTKRASRMARTDRRKQTS
jgi:hypothetical protein